MATDSNKKRQGSEMRDAHLRSAVFFLLLGGVINVAPIYKQMGIL